MTRREPLLSTAIVPFNFAEETDKDRFGNTENSTPPVVLIRRHAPVDWRRPL